MPSLQVKLIIVMDFSMGLPDCEIAKLQRVQNAAARLLMSCKKYDHITPVLINLHWLPVRYRINFKILFLTFKALYGMVPSYIIGLIHIKTITRYSLRSTEASFGENEKVIWWQILQFGCAHSVERSSC